MLQTLRKSVGSFVIKILFVLLVLSFAVWGIGDSFFGSGGANTVAEVGDREISVRELQDGFRAEMDRLRRFNIDEEQARQLGVLDQVLERLIAVSLVEEAARDMGLVASQSVIQKMIRQQLGQNITEAELNARLRNAGMSEAQYVGQLRRQIINTDYQGSLASRAQAPKVLVDRLYQWRGEKRAISTVTVPVKQDSPVAAPTAAQVEAHYKAHPAEYTAPEFRAVSYVFLNPKTDAEKITVAEEKLRTLYEERKSQFIVPERRTILQMLVPDRATADKAIDRLRQGADFVAVAKELADQEESATKLGTVTKAELPAEIAEAAFGLAKDKISDPVEGPFGLQIFKVTDVEAGKTPSFEDVRSQLAKEAAEEAAIDAVLAQTNKLEEAIGGGASLADAAQELGLQLHKVSAIDREGRGRKDTPVPGLPATPFLQTAFETDVDQDSLLVETSDSAFFILHVDSVTAPALKPLDAVREEVIDDWKSEQRWKTARETAQKIVDRLNNGAKISDVAAESNLEIKNSKGITRAGEGAPANMPSSLVADIFAAKSVGRAALADGIGGVDVAQLTAITMAAPADDKEAVDQLKQSLDFGITNDISAQLIDALRERYGVNINRAAIQANFYSDAGNY